MSQTGNSAAREQLADNGNARNIETVDSRSFRRPVGGSVGYVHSAADKRFVGGSAGWVYRA
jgi:hypothetical protein